MAAKAKPGSGGASGPLASVNWKLIMTWLVRVLAVVWFAKGVVAWGVIIGLDIGSGVAFEDQGIVSQSIIVSFAVVDIVASVGLWLLAPWGGVVWLLTATTRVALVFVAPVSIGPSLIGSGFVAAAILAFLVIGWLAGREQPAS
jgi:hypothetical protein